MAFSLLGACHLGRLLFLATTITIIIILIVVVIIVIVIIIILGLALAGARFAALELVSTYPVFSPVPSSSSSS